MIISFWVQVGKICKKLIKKWIKSIIEEMLFNMKLVLDEWVTEFDKKASTKIDSSVF